MEGGGGGGGGEEGWSVGGRRVMVGEMGEGREGGEYVWICLACIFSMFVCGAPCGPVFSLFRGRNSAESWLSLFHRGRKDGKHNFHSRRTSNDYRGVRNTSLGETIRCPPRPSPSRCESHGLEHTARSPPAETQAAVLGIEQHAGPSRVSGDRWMTLVCNSHPCFVPLEGSRCVS